MSPIWWDVAFLLFCAAIAAARAKVLVAAHAPVGVDPGNWLAVGRQLIGQSVQGAAIAYPPVVPLALLAAVSVFGATNGVILVGVASSLAPAFGVYIVLRFLRLGAPAALIAALLVPASATGEAVAWGGFPQLIGLGLSVAFLYLVDLSLRTNRVNHGITAGLVLAALLATSHLIGGIAVLAGIVIIILHLTQISATTPIRWLYLTRSVALYVVPTLPLVPLYLQISKLRFSSESTRLPLAEFPRAVDFLFRDSANLWWGITALTAVTPILLLRRRREPLWTMTASLLIASLMVLAITRELRFVYLLPIAAALALGCWAQELRDVAGHRNRLAVAAMYIFLAGALVAQTIAGLNFFSRQRDYYRVLSSESLRAISWVEENTPADSLIAVSPAKGEVRLGSWIEGLAQRRTLSASNPRWLFYPTERTSEARARQIFGMQFPTPAGLSRAGALHVDYVFVSKLWEGYDSLGRDRLERAAPRAIVWENSEVLLIRTVT